MRSPVKAALTPQEASGRRASAGPAAGEQLAFPLPAAQLSEFVGLAGLRQVHAVPWMPRTRKRLGFESWCIRAFCGRVFTDAVAGTNDPADIDCQACLRVMRQVGVLR